MSFEWDHQQIERLADLYRQKTELWDPKDHNYHIKNKKNDAWRWIADEMRCPIEELRTKMNSLLSSFRREKTKIKKSFGTGKGREDIYQSNWFAFKYFAFMLEKDTPINNMNTVNTENSLCEENLIDDPQLSLNEFDKSQPASENTEFPKATNEDSQSCKRKLFLSPQKQNTKTKKKKEEDLRLTQAFKIMDAVANKSPDECSTFGEHISIKLKKFNEQKQSILMHQINSLIFEAEMELYYRVPHHQLQTHTTYSQPESRPQSVSSPTLSQCTNSSSQPELYHQSRNSPHQPQTHATVHSQLKSHPQSLHMPTSSYYVNTHLQATSQHQFHSVASCSPSPLCSNDNDSTAQQYTNSFPS